MKRTPRNYDGVSSPGKSLGSLLSEALDLLQNKPPIEGAAVIQAWPEIVGPKAAPMTRAVSFVDGVLTVCVNSSALYSLLCLHERRRLLSLLQSRFPKTMVRDLVFRIG